MGNKQGKKSKSKRHGGKEKSAGSKEPADTQHSTNNTPTNAEPTDGTTSTVNGTNGTNGHATSPPPSTGPVTTAAATAETAAEPETDDAEEEGETSWMDNQTLFNKDSTSTKVTKDDFECLKVIGKGSFGKVMQVKKKDDGKIYAMKVLRKEAIIARKQVAHTKAEKNILAKIKHPFIVNLNYAFQTEEKLYMVLDYVNGGELFYHLKKEGRFPENRVRFYAAEIASAMGHLHSLGIVYRDLKPENILLDSEGHICITDFGLSKEIKPEEGTHTFCGTPEYLAPEVLKGQGHGTAVDWWSLGTLVYEMLTGLPPFYSQNINIMYQKILNGELKFPSFITPPAQSFISGLLTRDPTKRLGTGPNGMANIQNHPFFKGLDWAKLEAKQIEPPFKPKVKSDTDTSQIDPVFLQEKAVDSVVDTSALSETFKREAKFEDFTFVNESVMGEA